MTQSVSNTVSRPKRIGAHLIEAGLLTPDQVTVALNDQQATGMRFGEVLVARGWVKEQTIEWVMEKVVVPERRALERHKQTSEKREMIAVSRHKPASAATGSRTPTNPGVATTDEKAKQLAARRLPPISKPLPPVNSSDGDVNWVG